MLVSTLLWLRTSATADNTCILKLRSTLLRLELFRPNNIQNKPCHDVCVFTSLSLSLVRSVDYDCATKASGLFNNDIVSKYGHSRASWTQGDDPGPQFKPLHLSTGFRLYH